MDIKWLATVIYYYYLAVYRVLASLVLLVAGWLKRVASAGAWLALVVVVLSSTRVVVLEVCSTVPC